MLKRLIVPFSFLLALAAGPGLAQRPVATSIHSGSISLDLAPAALSSLGLDVDELGGLLCSQKTGLAECGLTVPNSAGLPAFVLDVIEVRPVAGGGATLAVEPHGLSLAGSLKSLCGPWLYQARLDPLAVQPTSQLTLLPPASPGSATSTFSGTVKVLALLHFDSQSGYPAADLPETLFFEVTGSWTTVNLERGLPAGASNLALLFERQSTLWNPLPTLATGSCTALECRCGHRLWLQGDQSIAIALDGSHRTP